MGFALGSAVVHHLWQGALIGLGAAAVLAILRRRSANARYVVGCVALALMLVSFGATFGWALAHGPTDLSAATASGSDAGPEEEGASLGGIAPYLPTVAWTWLLGAVLMVARLAVQWRAARRLTTVRSHEICSEWRTVVQTLCEQLGVHRAIRVLRSELAEVPMVIGWMAPVILVPVSAFTSLTPEQLRSVLAHELSHIRRLDYLVNTLQAIVESILFFHPVVWWLSHRVRVEREYCCDDAAVRVSGPALTYANALARLEDLRVTRHELALAANGGSLMNRISRIVGVKPQVGEPRSGWVAMTVLTGLLGLVLSGLTPVTAQERGEKGAKIKVMLREVAAKLEAEVRAGNLTDKEAKKKLAAYKAKLVASRRDKAAQSRYLEAKKKITAAVRAGKLTEEEGVAKLEAFKKKLNAQPHTPPGKKTRRAPKTKLEKIRVKVEAAAKKLDAEVAAGRMTKDEARAKMDALKKKLQGNQR